MRLQPQYPGLHERIDSGFGPPCGFIAMAMQFAMMSSAKRDRKLVAGFAAKRSALGKSQMMSVGRLSAAD